MIGTYSDMFCGDLTMEFEGKSYICSFEENAQVCDWWNNLLVQQVLDDDISLLQIEIPRVSRGNYGWLELRQIPR